METVREFLESSTIHGLAHISTGKVRYIFSCKDTTILFLQSKPVKVAWLTIVLMGFLSAGHLISKSYTAWQAITTITITITQLGRPPQS